MHYEVFNYETQRISLLQDARKVAIVLDESQKIKNPDAAISVELHSIRNGFVRRIIMTGTPVSNRPYDLWSQIFFLDGGEALGRDFKKFKADFDLGAPLQYDDQLRRRFVDGMAWIQERIKPFSVRKTKETAGIDLPKKHLVRLSCTLSPLQAQMYATVRDELSLEVQMDDVTNIDRSDSILKRLMRLVQLASNPRLVDERYEEIPGKYEALDELVAKIVNRGEKVIVWTTFIDNAIWLTKQLERYSSRCVHGELSFDSRERSLKAFMEDDATKVLVATTGAAKEGLTLTVANHAVFYDRSFSLDDFLQAQDRIHRISQTRECFVYVLMADGSIDEWVDMLIDAKRLAAELTQGDISSSDYCKRENYDFFETLKQVLGSGDV